MRDKEANIVITYGSASYKFLWIRQTDKGIYYGLHDRTCHNLHMSYHTGGKRHTVIKGREEQKFQSIPLSAVTGIFPITTICPGAFETTRALSIPYDNEPLKNIVWIDMRLFPCNSAVNISVYLVKPEKISDLSSPWFSRKAKADYHLIQIINAFDPWLLVHAQGISATN